MNYSIGDRVKIVEDGWGCSERIGQVVTILSIIDGANYELLMDDGDRLDYIWKQGFRKLNGVNENTAIYLLKQIYEAVKHLPNKDWLDPSLERAAKGFLEKMK